MFLRLLYHISWIFISQLDKTRSNSHYLTTEITTVQLNSRSAGSIWPYKYQRSRNCRDRTTVWTGQ